MVLVVVVVVVVGVGGVGVGVGQCREQWGVGAACGDLAHRRAAHTRAAFWCGFDGWWLWSHAL